MQRVVGLYICYYSKNRQKHLASAYFCFLHKKYSRRV